jgi:hypothetical protein
MKRKIVNAIAWGILGAAVLALIAARAYIEGCQESGPLPLPKVWPANAILLITNAAGKGFMGCFLISFVGSLFRSWLKSLPSNPHKKD